MRQLLIRAVALLRRPAVIIAVLLMAGGGTALVFVPLFGVPGYELGEALALAVGVLGAIPALASAFQERRLIQGRDPRPQGALRSDGALGSAARALGAAFLLNVVVLVPPFLTALIHSVWSTNCNPLSNIGFFPWLTLPSALIASAVGVLTGLTMRKWWSAGGLYLLIVLASLAVTGWPIYFGPQVFAFNPFLGYFPGPLYDEALTLLPPVYWFRLQTVLLAAAAWLFTAFTLDMKEGRVRRPHFRPGSATLPIRNAPTWSRIERAWLASSSAAAADSSALAAADCVPELIIVIEPVTCSRPVRCCSAAATISCITRVTSSVRLVMSTSASLTRLVVPAPVDYVAWTQRVARFADRPDLAAADRQILVTGRVSPRARQELERRRWTVREGVEGGLVGPGGPAALEGTPRNPKP